MNQQLNQFEQSEQPSYQASAPEPKHFLNKKFIIAFVVLILLGGAAYAGIWLWQKQQLANEVVPTFTPRADETAGWKTYTNTQYGFEFKYPESFVIKEDARGVSVSHGVKYTHADPCDFRDGSHVLNDVVDFNASLKIFNGNIESAVKANYAFPDDIISGGKFKLSPDFVDTYLAGSLKGHRVKIGAEGCGLNTYYFPLSNSHTLIVRQLFTPERTSLILDYEKFFSLPGIIKPAEEEKIFNQILSTFKFIDSTTVGSSIFTSQKLGISFTYATKQGSPVIEDGNRVYVGGKTGQWVEEFIKNPNDSLETAVTKQFLNGYSPKDCFMKTYDLKLKDPSFVSVQIVYPAPTDPNAPWFTNSSKCPQVYSATNGISYFLMDKNHPGKFFFFSIGQYAILAQDTDYPSGAKTWQDTFRVIK